MIRPAVARSFRVKLKNQSQWLKTKMQLFHINGVSALKTDSATPLVKYFAANASRAVISLQLLVNSSMPFLLLANSGRPIATTNLRTGSNRKCRKNNGWLGCEWVFHY